MPSITITIPDADENTIVDNFCEHLGFTGSQGETKRQFVKRKLIDYIKYCARTNARDVAYRSSGGNVDTVVIT